MFSGAIRITKPRILKNPRRLKDTQKTNLIFDRANEDHCGTCGNGLLTHNPDVNYHIRNHNPMNNVLLEKVFTEDEQYYLPFII